MKLISAINMKKTLRCDTRLTFPEKLALIQYELAMMQYMEQKGLTPFQPFSDLRSLLNSVHFLPFSLY